jgi:hypothetical protein
MNKERALRFLDLQALVNREIEVYGQISIELADQLEELGDELTAEEIDYVLEIKGESMNKVNVKALGNVFSIFGNKGNVWTNTAHAYQSGRGNLCGTPALSSNHAAMSGIEEVGCPECLKQIAISGYVQVPLNR